MPWFNPQYHTKQNKVKPNKTPMQTGGILRRGSDLQFLLNGQPHSTLCCSKNSFKRKSLVATQNTGIRDGCSRAATKLVIAPNVFLTLFSQPLWGLACSSQQLSADQLESRFWHGNIELFRLSGKQGVFYHKILQTSFYLRNCSHREKAWGLFPSKDVL